MGWVTAVASIAAAQQASAVGKYNQAIQERNAVVAEQEKERLEQRLEFDLARFDQQFAELQGQTKTRIVKSGAELSGSGLRILRSNAEQAQSRKLEEANFARMSGQMARMEARQAQIGYYAQAGQSLLTNYGSPFGKTTGDQGLVVAP